MKQNPTTKALELKDWYAPSNAIWLRKRDLDMNVTGPVFEYKGKEYTGPVEQGMPHLAARHQRARRRGPPHAGRSHAAGLQRGGAVRRRRDLGRALDLGGHRRHALGADAVLGAEALAVQGADRARRGRAGRRSPRSSSKSRRGKVQLAPAWMSRNMNQADPAVIANGVVFAYGSGEDATQATVDIGLAYNTRRTARDSTHAELLRARRAHRRGAVVERRPDHRLQPLHQPVGRQRPRLHRHATTACSTLRRRRRKRGGTT